MTMSVPEPYAPLLTLRLFGPLEVRVAGQPLPRLRTRKGQWLLALLALRAGRALDRDWLAGTLWLQYSQRQALSSLRRCLTDLRQALGPAADLIHSPTPHSLCLTLPFEAVDALVFDAAAKSEEPSSLEQAVSLYGGPLLEGCEEEWVLGERAGREQVYLQALERLAQGRLQQGEPSAAIDYLRLAIRVDPVRESAQRGLMQALAASGDSAAAVQVYRELRWLLRQQLNAEVDPQTTLVFEQIRAEARERAQSRRKDLPVSVAASAASPSETPEVLSSLEAGSHSTLTLLFTDIEDSTRLWEKHPQAMRQALQQHDALLRQVIEQHQGEVFKTIGDAFCAVFATATDALQAAVSAQKRLQSQEWPEEAVVQVRMGLHSGAVERREGDYFGQAVNRVAGLLALGHAGQILLSGTTRELIGETWPEHVRLRELGQHRLKGVEQPVRVYEAQPADLAREFPALRSPDAWPNNLPLPLTSFIGRGQERQTLAELLQQSRLLTLTGAGGCGKTRLALEAASAVLYDYHDGVWLVELAALSDSPQVPLRVLQALGAGEEPGRTATETLTDYLRSKTLLLVLDNCEHLVEACAQVTSALLASCPQLRLLATSRQALGLTGEVAWSVPPLATPDLGSLHSTERPTDKEWMALLLEYEALQLFAARARQAVPHFQITAQNVGAVAQVCTQLDGMPLAIELAAAWVRALSVEQIALRLADRFGLLQGGSRTAQPRQQTLRATLDWSYDLLTEPEQRLLARLSVFAGGWSLEAAEGVCTSKDEGGRMKDESHSIHPSSFILHPFDVLVLLSSLIDKSLVGFAVGRDGAGRYGLLETVREYARERLEASGEAGQVRDRHREYFLALAEAAEPHLIGAAQGMWLQRLETEHDNLRAALEWSLKAGERGKGKGEREEGSNLTSLKSQISSLSLAGALWQFWMVRGYLSEGRKYLEEVLGRQGAADGTQARAKVLNGAGVLASHQGDYTAARALFEESLAIQRELGNKGGIASSLNNLGTVASTQGDYTAARAQSEESLAIYRELGNKEGIVESLSSLGYVACSQGDYTAARALSEESLAIQRELGNKGGIANSLNGLGNVALYQGNYTAARAQYEESLAIQRELGDKGGSAFSLNGLGSVAYEQGDYTAARALYEESLAIYRELGDKGAIANSLNGLGYVTSSQGEYTAARALFEESLAIQRELGDKWGSATSLMHLGYVACSQGDYGSARALYEESLTLEQELGNKGAIANSLEAFAGLARAEDQPERAARLWGASQALRQALGSPLPPNKQEGYERNLAAVREALGEEAFTSAREQGRTMPLEQAINYALNQKRITPPDSREQAIGSGD